LFCLRVSSINETMMMLAAPIKATTTSVFTTDTHTQ